MIFFIGYVRTRDFDVREFGNRENIKEVGKSLERIRSILSLFRGYFKLRIPYSNFHENLRVGKIYATPIGVYFGDFRDGDTE